MSLTKKAEIYKYVLFLSKKFYILSNYQHYCHSTTEYWETQFKILKGRIIDRNLLIKKILFVLPESIELEIYKYLY